jgi:hypothetical protein
MGTALPFVTAAIALIVTIGPLAHTAAPPPSLHGPLCAITKPNCCDEAATFSRPCNR